MPQPHPPCWWRHIKCDHSCGGRKKRCLSKQEKLLCGFGKIDKMRRQETIEQPHNPWNLAWLRSNWGTGRCIGESMWVPYLVVPKVIAFFLYPGLQTNIKILDNKRYIRNYIYFFNIWIIFIQIIYYPNLKHIKNSWIFRICIFHLKLLSVHAKKLEERNWSEYIRNLYWFEKNIYIKYI